MIDIKVLKKASDTKYLGLKNNFTHKCSFKNKTCGDKISLEIIMKNSKIKTMRYEINSCIYSQASASMLANSIKLFNRKNLKKKIKLLNLYSKNDNFSLPTELKKFNCLFNKKNYRRLDCIMLPFNALVKAIKQ